MELIPQRFRCSLVPGDGVGGRLAVTVEVGAAGVSLVREDTRRELQVLPLASLARWDTLGTPPYVAGVALLVDGAALPGGLCSPVVGTRLSPGTGGLSENVYEVVMESDSRTGREILDTIVTTCHQVHEVRKGRVPGMEQTYVEVGHASHAHGDQVFASQHAGTYHGNGLPSLQVADDEALAKAITASWEEQDRRGPLHGSIDRLGLVQNSSSSRGSTGIFVPREDWVPDAAIDECEACSALFGIVRRKHHCRQCGHIFCDACCPKIRGSASTRERICTICSTGRLPLAFEHVEKRAAEMTSRRPDTSQDAEFAARLQAEINADVTQRPSRQGPPSNIFFPASREENVSQTIGESSWNRHAEDAIALQTGVGGYKSIEQHLCSSYTHRPSYARHQLGLQHTSLPSNTTCIVTNSPSACIGTGDRVFSHNGDASHQSQVPFSETCQIKSSSAFKHSSASLSSQDLRLQSSTFTSPQNVGIARSPVPSVISVQESATGTMSYSLGDVHEDIDPGLRDLQFGVVDVKSEVLTTTREPSIAQDAQMQAVELRNALPSTPKPSPAERRLSAIAAARARDAATESA